MKKLISIILIIVMLMSLAGCKGSFTVSAELQTQIFDEFKDIAAVSRQTYATDRMTTYIIDTLKEIGIEAESDDAGNVIAEVSATSGLENRELIIIQTNMDFDLTPYGTDENGYYDPLDVLNTDGKIMGDERNLGLDSGMMMATLFTYLRNGGVHGPLRLIFTTDKVADFIGAKALDKTALADAKYLINLSGDSQTRYYNSSYGESELIAWNIAPKYTKATLDQEVLISIYGLIGGSADTEVAKGRINAADVMMDLLLGARNADMPFEIVELMSGDEVGTVPESASIKMYINSEEASFLWNVFVEAVSPYKEQYSDSDPELQIHMENYNNDDEVLDAEQQENLLNFAASVTNGKQSDTAFVNLGMVDVNTLAIRFDQLIRSSNADEFESMVSDRETLIEENGLTAELKVISPVWEASESSALEKLAQKKYKKLFGTEYVAKTSLKGHECSVLKELNSNIDIISIGLDVFDSGTEEEFTNLETANKYYCLLESVLKEAK